MKNLCAWALSALLFAKSYATGVISDNGYCAAVDYQRTGQVTEDIIGVYDMGTDCTSSEGGDVVSDVSSSLCYRKDDGSNWRIWNSGCGWLIGYRDSTDTWVTVATSSLAGDCTTSYFRDFSYWPWYDTAGTKVDTLFVGAGPCSFFNRPSWDTTSSGGDTTTTSGGDTTTTSGGGDTTTTSGGGDTTTTSGGGDTTTGSGGDTTTGSGGDTTQGTTYYVAYTAWEINVTISTPEAALIEDCAYGGVSNIVGQLVEETVSSMLLGYAEITSINNVTAIFEECTYATTPTDNEILNYRFEVQVWFTYESSASDGNSADDLSAALQAYVSTYSFTENLNSALQATYTESQVTDSGVQITYSQVSQASTLGEGGGNNKGGYTLWIIGAVIIIALIILAIIIYVAVYHVNRRKQNAKQIVDDDVVEDRVARLQSLSDNNSGAVGVDPLAVGVIGVGATTSAFGESHVSGVPIISADQCEQMDTSPVYLNVQHPIILNQDEAGKVLIFNEGPVPTLPSIAVGATTLGGDTNQNHLGEEDSDEDVPARSGVTATGGNPESI